MILIINTDSNVNLLNTPLEFNVTCDNLFKLFFSATKLTRIEKYDSALRIRGQSCLAGSLILMAIHHAARQRLSIKLSDRRSGFHGLPCRIYHTLYHKQNRQIILLLHSTSRWRLPIHIIFIPDQDPPKCLKEITAFYHWFRQLLQTWDLSD